MTIQDRWTGLILAILSSCCIGISFIITKKGLQSANQQSSGTGISASDSYAYLVNPIWWLGMLTMIIGEVANFAAYAFAPPILVTPLGALSVIIGAVLASFLLNEKLGKIGRTGCALCLVGSLIIILHAPEDKEISTVDEILWYATRPAFLTYVLAVFSFCGYMIVKVVPDYGRTNPIVYLSICSTIGSISVMAVKGLGIALKLTFAGDNQFTHASTYLFAFFVVSCILCQMAYFNKALDTFSTNVVNPIYYVLFSTATITASIILFQGFGTSGAADTFTLLAGFVTIFLGVYLLNIARMMESHEHSHIAGDNSVELADRGYSNIPHEDYSLPDIRDDSLPLQDRARVSRLQDKRFQNGGSQPQDDTAHRRVPSGTLFDAFEEQMGNDISDREIESAPLRHRSSIDHKGAFEKRQ